MANYNNRPSGVKSRNTSQFSGTQTDRLAFDDDKQAYRYFNVDCPEFTRIESTCDSNGNVTQLVYYNGLTEKIVDVETLADSGGSLNNLYFIMSSTYDQQVFYVWYNVNGAGSDPSLPGLTGIEVGIQTNDSANIVAMATEGVLNLNAVFNYLFSVVRVDNKLTITNKTKGTSSLGGAGTSGFVYNEVQQGTEEVTGVITIQYDANQCITGLQKN